MTLLDEISVAVCCEVCGEDAVVAGSSLLSVTSARAPARLDPSPPRPRRKASVWLRLPAPLYRTVRAEAARADPDRLALGRWENEGGRGG